MDSGCRAELPEYHCSKSDEIVRRSVPDVKARHAGMRRRGEASWFACLRASIPDLSILEKCGQECILCVRQAYKYALDRIHSGFSDQSPIRLLAIESPQILRAMDSGDPRAGAARDCVQNFLRVGLAPDYVSGAPRGLFRRAARRCKTPVSSEQRLKNATDFPVEHVGNPWCCSLLLCKCGQ